jgi:ssRNA-specific RNase YbeY (16S rRNA maturation enzyme)
MDVLVNKELISRIYKEYLETDKKTDILIEKRANNLHRHFMGT